MYLSQNLSKRKQNEKVLTFGLYITAQIVGRQTDREIGRQRNRQKE